MTSALLTLTKPELYVFNGYQDTGIPVNIRTDVLAKLGATGNQPVNLVTHQEKATAIKTLTKPNSSKDDSISGEMGASHHVKTSYKAQQVKRPHVYQAQAVNIPLCVCGQQQQTADHILQRCQGLKKMRKTVWPTSTSVQTEGCPEEDVSFRAYPGLKFVVANT